MPHIPGRRAVLAAGGSIALLLGSTPGTAVAPPTGNPASGSTAVTDCAPEAPSGLAEGLTETVGAAPGYTPATGTVSALTVFIDFPDAEAEISTRERFAEFFPETAEHFAASSYGRLDYRAVPVHRWLRMSQPFEDYGIDRGAGWRPDDDQGYNRLLHEIVDALADDPDFPGFGDHDLVNVLATPNAGPPATQQVLSVTFPGRDLVPTPDGGALRDVSFIWSHQPGDPYRVLLHENGHVFGLPDLYWTDQAPAPESLAGHWDVMEQDWGPRNDFLAWHKWKLGWLSADQVECVAEATTTEHELTPVGAPGTDGTRLVAVRTGEHEALAVEVRAPGGLDDLVCRPGVLVSRVSTGTASGLGPVRVADATPDSAGCQPTPDPQVTAELTDAPFVPGETFRDRDARVSVHVLDADDDGRHRIRVTRW